MHHLMLSPRGIGALIGASTVAVLATPPLEAGACSCGPEFLGGLELVSVEKIEGADDVADELLRWGNTGAVQVFPNSVEPDELIFFVSEIAVYGEKSNE